jgi:hypothetical protein
MHEMEQIEPLLVRAVEIVSKARPDRTPESADLGAWPAGQGRRISGDNRRDGG